MIKIIASFKILFLFVLISCQSNDVLTQQSGTINKISAFETLNLQQSLYLKLTPSTQLGLSPIEVHFPYRNQQNILRKGSNLKFSPFKQVLMRFAYVNAELQSQFAETRGFFRIDKYILSEALQDLDPFSDTQLLFQYPNYIQYGNDGIDFNLNYLITIFPNNLPPYQFKADTEFTLDRMDDTVNDQDYFNSRYIKNQKNLPLTFQTINGNIQGFNYPYLPLKAIEAFTVQNQNIFSTIALSDIKGEFSISIYDQDNLLYDPSQNDRFDLYLRSKAEGDVQACWKLLDLTQDFLKDSTQKQITLPLSDALEQSPSHIFFQAIPYDPISNQFENLQEWQFDLVSTIDFSDIIDNLNMDQRNEPSILPNQLEISSHFNLNPNFYLPYEIDGMLNTLSPQDMALIYEKRLLFIDLNTLPENHYHSLYIYPPASSRFKAQHLLVNQNQIANFVLDLGSYPKKTKVSGKILNQSIQPQIELRQISQGHEIYQKPFAVLQQKTQENGDFELWLDEGEYLLVIPGKAEENPPFIGYFEVIANQESIKLKDISLSPLMIWELYPTLFNDTRLLPNIYTELYCELTQIKELNPNTQAKLDDRIKVLTYFNPQSNVIRLPISAQLCQIYSLQASSF